MIAEPVSVLLELVEIFRDLDIQYVVGGSFASSIFGEPRSTADIDVMASLVEMHVPNLVKRLHDRFYVDEPAIREAIRGRTSFNAIHLESMLKIDVFVAGNQALDREQMNRRRLVVLRKEPERAVYMTAPENIVLRKLDWYRASGGVSDRQWRDVVGVLKLQAEALDREYMEKIAAEVGLTKLLAQAMSDAGQ